MPGLPADVLKVQVSVPPLGIQPPGKAALVLIENGLASQAGVTIWISHKVTRNENTLTRHTHIALTVMWHV